MLAAGLSLLGMFIYLPHRAELQQPMHSGFSDWSASEVISHCLLASSAPYWPLLPLWCLALGGLLAAAVSRLGARFS